MFNTINNSSKTTINTPACGIIQKSNLKSFMIKTHTSSIQCETIFSDRPRFNGKNIVVLQVLLMDKNYLLVELVETSEL